MEKQKPMIENSFIAIVFTTKDTLVEIRISLFFINGFYLAKANCWKRKQLCLRRFNQYSSGLVNQNCVQITDFCLLLPILFIHLIFTKIEL